MKLIFFLLVIFFCACNHPANQDSSSRTDDAAIKKPVSTVLQLGGKFIIDTTAILENHNLPGLIHDLKTTELVEKTTIAAIPPFIKSFLDSLTNDFSIADPGEDWQVGCTNLGKPVFKTVFDKKTGDSMTIGTFDNSQPLPARQLVYLGIGKDLILMTYKTGGICGSEHIVIIKSENEKISDFWCANLLVDVKNKSQILHVLETNKDINETSYIYL